MQLRNVLVVDDDQIAREMLRSALERLGHTVLCAGGGDEALEQLTQNHVRMVITDWMMEPMDGLRLCRAIRERRFSHYVYIIMLSARDDPVDIAQGMDAGADDFVTKPFHPVELAARIKAGVRTLSLETRDVTIFALARLAESRDSETGMHLERVRNYVRILAEQLAQSPTLFPAVTGDFVQMLYDTSPLHDIGKVAIPDAILLKPGKLNASEYEIMKRHVVIGAATLDEALTLYPEAKFLEMARDIAATHHEKYDGTGYPAGLAGERIPLCGRIMALADVYDAITSKRVYKEAHSHEFACQEIQKEAGKHFDPRLVEAFFQKEKDILVLREYFLELEQAQKTFSLAKSDWLPLVKAAHALAATEPLVSEPRT